MSHYQAIFGSLFVVVLNAIGDSLVSGAQVVNKSKTTAIVYAQGTVTLTEDQIDQKVRGILSEMTLEEKVRQMSGDWHLFPQGIRMLFVYNRTPIPAGANERLDIPPILFSDGSRGVVMHHATCFPVSMARGASWDPALEERIGNAIGIEARSLGANYYGGVCINLLRHPAWGRAQETYGEDPFLLGEMGAALTAGVQRHIMACVKHFALNSMENKRFSVDVRVDERTLHEVYLPHFKRCVDAGAASVMSAYNRVNGEWCSHSRQLLAAILKNEWGFKGFVLSDFAWAVHDAKGAALGGLDVEMPLAAFYRRDLARLVEQKMVPDSIIDNAVFRILRQKFRFAQIGDSSLYKPSAVLCPEHIALAREAAHKSIVLLKNAPTSPDDAPLLPLNGASTGRIAVFGRLADRGNFGDRGSSTVFPPYIVTPLQGIRAAAGKSEVVFADGGNRGKTLRLARSADVSIVVVGNTFRDEGEYTDLPVYRTIGGDRKRLTLSSEDEALICRVRQATPRVVVVLVGGSAFVTEAWRHRIPAILASWYGGMEGGNAVGDILFGKVNPSGKLPCTFPASDDQLPFFDRDAEKITYGYYHGYRLLDKNGQKAAFPFGFGLSYTSYTYKNLSVGMDTVAESDSVTVSVDVTNSGSRAGEEIVLLFTGCRGRAVDYPVKTLKGFKRVPLSPRETRTVTFTLRPRDLTYYDAGKKMWRLEAGMYELFVGSSSEERDLLRKSIRIMTEGGSSSDVPHATDQKP